MAAVGAARARGDRARRFRRRHGTLRGPWTSSSSSRSFVIILAGAELFTNGIEWFGRKLGLAEGAVGSVLAAVGTALPETMIPIIAILFSTGEHSEEIGVGAILGAPFMLATLAMFVTGVAVMIQARKRPQGDVMPVNTEGPRRRTCGSFVITYGLAIAAAIFLPSDPALAEDRRRDRAVRGLRAGT